MRWSSLFQSASIGQVTSSENALSAEKTAYEQKPFVAPHGATEVLLVRHGASQAFVPGEPFPMLGPQGNPALSPLGQQQAKLVGARLATEPITAAYATRLVRTVETAQPLVDATGIDLQINQNLHEIFLGEWEGGVSRIKMAELTDPVAKEVVSTGRWDLVPGAEKYDDFGDRCMTGLQQLIDAHTGGNVVAFVHGGVIGAIASRVVGGEGRVGIVDNCSVSHVVSLDGRLILKSFNDTAHLGGLFTGPPTI